MDFLKRNSGKLALLAIIVFFTLPFIYGNEEEDEDFSPFAVKSGMSYQANPISKLANRIASFYGFPKPANEMVASNSLMDPVKGKVADHHIFSKESTSNPDYKAELGSNSDFKDAANSRRNHGAVNNKNSNSIKDEVLMASAQRYKNFGTDYNGASSSVLGYAGQASSASYTSLPATSATRTNNPIKGTVKINGQKYNVIEDAKGERYVVTPRGHIPYKEVVRRSFSEKEFLAAKKRLGNVSDMEVLQELQRERAQREGSNGSASYHQQNAEGYRHGAASSVGGNSYASVSTGDKGFDDDLLSNAYADLKNISLGIGTPSSSSSGGSYSGGSSYGGALRDSYGGSSSGAGSEEQAEQEDVFSPADIAKHVKTQAKEGITTQNTKAKEQESEKEKEKEKAKEFEEKRELTNEQNNDAKPEIKPIIFDSTNIAVVGNEESPAAYMVNTQIDKYKGDWDNLEGDGDKLILPVKIEGAVLEGNIEEYANYKELSNDEKENLEQKVEFVVGNINGSVLQVATMLTQLEGPLSSKEIYIDCSGSDQVSEGLLKNIVESLSNINPNIKIISNTNSGIDNKDSIVLKGPAVLTSAAFKEFEENVKNKLEEIQKTEAENLSA